VRTRKVKIVATIGPETCNEKSLSELISSGLDMVRLNGSHNSTEWHREVILRIRKLSPTTPILLDMPGPKIRIKKADLELTIGKGEFVTFVRTGVPASPTDIELTYQDVFSLATIGDSLVCDGGVLQLRVDQTDGNRIRCVALTSGQLIGGKGVHLPKPGRVFELTDKDRHLMEFAKEMQVDYVGLSFVDSVDQIHRFKRIFSGTAIRVMAKVETAAALENLKEILEAADAVMLDRGDLASETDIKMLGVYQKRVLRQSKISGCPVLVATEVMMSMVNKRVPNKSEITDITNAVMDGASALMLSEETAVGKYPAEVIQLMSNVITVAEGEMRLTAENETTVGVSESLSDVLELVARKAGVTKIVAFTKSGYAAKVLSCRDLSVPIIAACDSPEVSRALQLFKNVTPAFLGQTFSPESADHILAGLKDLFRLKHVEAGDTVLTVGVTYPKPGNTFNTIQIHRIADLKETFKWNDPSR
jgi:pyruvate kinase